MIDLLDLKIRQMHASLGSLSTTDLSSIQPQMGEGLHGLYTKVDFNERSNDAELANAASLLISNIASLKDHLKVWCIKQGFPFNGERLVNSNSNVALVHDLWNLDKHAELNKPPRSGHTPKLVDLQRNLSISAGSSSGGAAFFSMDPRTGKMTTGTSGGGSVKLTLVAQVVDENGQVLGDFIEICTQAIEAWEQELANSGVPVP